MGQLPASDSLPAMLFCNLLLFNVAVIDLAVEVALFGVAVGRQRHGCRSVSTVLTRLVKLILSCWAAGDVVGTQELRRLASQLQAA